MNKTERMLEARRRERERVAALERPRPPAPSVPAEPYDVTASGVPSSPRSIARKAAAAGWWVRATRAVGPRIDAAGRVPPGDEQVPSIALALQSPGGRRIVAIWVYRGGKWTGDGHQDGRTGAMMSLKEIEEAIAS